jgi:hypothetical protein
MRVEPGKTYIGTVRLSSPERDVLALQLRLDHALAAMDLHLAGLPPSAILCVRALADPLPGALGLDRLASRPPADWEAALSAALNRLVRAAARPARDSVPAGAEAVLFADVGELLGCLAADWCAGRVVAHWWWKRLARGGDLRRTVLSTWHGAPEAIPAALAQLATWGEAARFMQALAPAEAEALTDVLLRRYALNELWTSLASTLAEHAPATDVTPHHTVRPVMRPPAPWRVTAPEADMPGLSVAGQLLLGLGLTLRRAPTVVRTNAFVRASVEWARPARTTSATPNTSTPLSRGIDLEPAPEPAEVPVHRPAVENGASLGHGARGITWETPPISKKAGVADGVAPLEVKAHPPVAPGSRGRAVKRRVAFPLPEREIAHGTAPAYLSHSPRPTQSAPARADLPLALGMAIQTRWGGLFYLLNVALALSLYGDFTSPSERGLPLSPWDFLALCGERLVGRGLRDDPVWGLLAALAERATNDELGADFLPDDDWRVPATWLVPFAAPRVWSWRVDGDRLLVTHPAGFRVLDVALELGNPLEQVRRETARYGAIPFRLRRARPLASTTRSTRGRWLAALVDYIRARLRGALGAVPKRDVGRFVCAHHADVTTTATHVSIAFSLYALPIEIRLAGLDRDPGWVPAAGRTITFFFA